MQFIRAILRHYIMEGSSVYTTAEIAIGELDEVKFSRELDEQTGFKELFVSKRWQSYLPPPTLLAAYEKKHWPMRWLDWENNMGFSQKAALTKKIFTKKSKVKTYSTQVLMQKN